jgi:3-hydroxypropionate dehydrogenase (NADP+)
MHNNIKKVVCVGSGLIGRGWATLFLAKGYEVTMQDLSEDLLKSATEQIALNLKFMESNGLLQKGKATPAGKHIRTTTELAEAVRGADYIQESVFDNYPVKKKVFKALDALVTADTIIASSSSGLLMSEIQTVVTRPERCVLTHPFLPVHLIPLVEIVGGGQTSPETVQVAYDLMVKLGKVPVRLKKEVSGYIVNRLQAAILREAVDLVVTGVASAEEVDKAFCAGIGMRDPFIGPLLRAHLAGDGIESFLENYSDSYRVRWESMATWKGVSPLMREALVKKVKAMPIVCENSLDQIKNWRDRMLVEMLKMDRTCC